MMDMSDPKLIRAAIKSNTKMVWIESPTNPTLKCVDIQMVAKICKAKGVVLVVDSTFMSPVL
jgi:cystathionine beta-lyase/cystathionine gamma-synthase